MRMGVSGGEEFIKHPLARENSIIGESITIVNFKGNIKQGDLILRGECIRCGGAVARLIEGG